MLNSSISNCLIHSHCVDSLSFGDFHFTNTSSKHTLFHYTFSDLKIFLLFHCELSNTIYKLEVSLHQALSSGELINTIFQSLLHGTWRMTHWYTNYTQLDIDLNDISWQSAQKTSKTIKNKNHFFIEFMHHLSIVNLIIVRSFSFEKFNIFCVFYAFFC